MIKNVYLIIFLFFLSSCSSLLKYEKAKEEFKTEEFDKQVKIVEVEEVNAEIGPVHPQVEEKKTDVTKEEKKQATAVTSKVTSKTTNKKSTAKSKINAKPEVTAKPLKRQPEDEDAEGFDNQRRPLIDPFKVGEKVVHEVSYLGATAGHLSLIVKPFAVVNGRKNYNFFIDIKSNSFFTRIFAVDDQVQTYVDYEDLTPGAFKLNINDSAQIKEARSYFDYDNLKANYWEHRYTEKSGHEEKKQNWTILPFSQNPFSAIFYMRVFKWAVGKECQFHVADDEKNVIFKAKAIEKTTLKTDVGEFKALKIKAEVVARGKLAKAQNFFLWISDDDRKYILRIEVELPIGSLVSQVVELKEGR